MRRSAQYSGHLGLMLAMSLTLAGCGSKNNSSASSSSSTATVTGTMSLYAGVPGDTGYFDGPAQSGARLYNPTAITTDGNGNYFIADRNNHVIRWMFQDSIQIGLPGGSGSSASPQQVWRTVTVAGVAGQTGSTDGTGSQAEFNVPQSLAIVPGTATATGGKLYVADTGNNTIRVINYSLSLGDHSTSPVTGPTVTATVSTLAGQAGKSGTTDGQGTGALFSQPTALATDPSGNVFITDAANNTVREMTSGGQVSTPALGVTFNQPGGIAFDGSGNMYVADTGNYVVREFPTGGGAAQVIGQVGVSGSANGTATAATFAGPMGLSVDSSGNVFVADSVVDTIRVIDTSHNVTTLLGTASVPGSADSTTASDVAFDNPLGVLVIGGGSSANLFVTDTGNNSIREFGLTYTSGVPLASTPLTSATILGEPDPIGSFSDGIGTTALFALLGGSAIDQAGNLYVVDSLASNVRVITTDGYVITLAGSTVGETGYANGAGSAARFNVPYDVAVDENLISGKIVLYVTDYGNEMVRMLVVGPTFDDVTVYTVAGSLDPTTSAPQVGTTDGAGLTSAKFHGPWGVAVQSTGSGTSNVFVSDSLNQTIRLITVNASTVATQGGMVSTYAGTGFQGSADNALLSSSFNSPAGLAIDSQGHYLYVADDLNDTVRRVLMPGQSSNGVTAVSTYLGTAGSSGVTDAQGTTARFLNPVSLAFDGNGNLYVADAGNNVIRAVDTNANVTTLVGQSGSGNSGFQVGTLPGLLNGPVSVAYGGTPAGKGPILYVNTSTVVAKVSVN